MKYLIIILDGAADFPYKELNYKTPLEVAKKPALDYLASCGKLAKACFLQEDMPYGSDVAILSILGYNPKDNYPGRAGLEALAMQVDINQGESVFRTNLVTIKNELMYSNTADGISTQEASPLIESLNQYFKDFGIKFYLGLNYRHIAKIKGDFSKVILYPPHDILNKPYRDYLPQGEGSEVLREIMIKSRVILENHFINKKRKEQNKEIANMVWFWAVGRKPDKFMSFQERFGKKGKIIGSVYLLEGIAKVLGLDFERPAGVTDYIDTDYASQSKATIGALKKDYDIVISHIQALDEVSHEGNLELKIKTIEDIDKRFIKEIIENIRDLDLKCKVLICPDHITSIYTRTHCLGEVPILFVSSEDLKNRPKYEKKFCENQLKKEVLSYKDGYKLMEDFFKHSF